MFLPIASELDLLSRSAGPGGDFHLGDEMGYKTSYVLFSPMDGLGMSRIRASNDAPQPAIQNDPQTPFKPTYKCVVASGYL